MKMSIGGLPLIGKILGKAFNRSDNSQDSESAER